MTGREKWRTEKMLDSRSLALLKLNLLKKKRDDTLKSGRRILKVLYM